MAMPRTLWNCGGSPWVAKVFVRVVELVMRLANARSCFDLVAFM